jgi:hypothetical protein
MATVAQKRKNREIMLKKYQHRYERHWSGRVGCFYCGDKWSELDHCPPLSWCDVKDHKWFKQRKIGFYLVNSCSDCNRALSDRGLFTLQERADFIRKRLERQAEKIVLWSKDEIKEMSDRFQKAILARQSLQNTLLERLWFAQELQFRAEDFPEQ